MTADVLLSGAVGALIVFVLGALREWWREEREGLLRLLLAEIDHNAEVQLTIEEMMMDDPLGSNDFRKVSADTWHAVQGRAAALLPDDLFASLNGYYAPLQTFLTLLNFDDHAKERRIRAMVEMHAELLEREFPRSRNPWRDYLATTRDARDRARAMIDQYLSLRWDDRLILRLRAWVDGRWRKPRADQ